MTPRNEVIQIKVDPEEKGRLKTFAKDRHETLSGYVRKAALSFPEYGKTPISYETQHDRENKAKGREAVANEEPYEVKVEPGTIQPKDTREEVLRAAERDSWIESTARILMMEKGLSKVAARMQASKEWDAR